MSAPGLSEIFIRRPAGTTLLMIAIMLSGIVAYRNLPVSALPRIDFPTVSVNASLPGADPETMASSVAAPLERRFGEIAGVSQLTSVSGLGTCRISVQFSLDRNIDHAVRDIQAAVNAARADLPPGLPSPPTFRKANPSEAPVLILALTSSELSAGKLYQAASTILAQRIAQVPGVSQVVISGAQKSAVRVRVDPQRLSAMGLSMEDVRTKLNSSDAHGPKGRMDGTESAYSIVSNDQLYSAESYNPIVLRSANGNIVRLSSVATAVNDVQDERIAAWYNTDRAVLVIISKQPDANVIETVDAVKELLPQAQKWMPPSIEMHIMNDRTKTIRASVADVQFTLLVSVCLVVGIVFIFLRRFWSTFAAASMVPLCLTGTFGGMYLCGFNVDNLSLMALTVAVGFVVDDAIVMIENVSRYTEQGIPPFQAAIMGARQIGFTVISISVSLIAVFIPLLFMSGLIGRLFHEFAVTLSIAVAVSAVVSLTGTPMLCAYLAPQPGSKNAEHKPGALGRFADRAFDWVLRGYGHGLDFVLRHRIATLIATAGTIALTVYLYIYIPKGFFPQQDTGRISITTEARADISFTAMMRLQRQVAEAVLKDPDVAALGSSMGSSGFGSSANQGSMFVDLKPMGERKIPVTDVITNLAKETANIRGIQVYLQPVQDLNIGGRASKSQFQYTLSDMDVTELNDFTPKLVEKLNSYPELARVTTDLTQGGIQIKVTIDRDAASRLGVEPQDIDATLYDAFGQRQVAIIYTDIDQYRVILESNPDQQTDPAILDRLYVKSASAGNSVPLRKVASFERSPVPLSVNHQGQFPAVTVSFNLQPDVSLSKGAELIDQAMAELNPPPGVHGGFQGTAQVYKDSINSTIWLVITSILAIYLILGILYESLIHPLTIISTIPSAGIGALLGLMLFGYALDIMGLIGIILLIGIVKKNAIMMIDVALVSEREHNKPPHEAIREACLLRFRPIIMTTLAAMFGALPLAVGTGTGSELRHPLGVAIVGGLIVSQALTLFTTPVVYVTLDKLRPATRKAAIPHAPAANTPVPGLAD